MGVRIGDALGPDGEPLVRAAGGENRDRLAPRQQQQSDRQSRDDPPGSSGRLERSGPIRLLGACEGEACDDGNFDPGDGCSPDFLPSSCWWPSWTRCRTIPRWPLPWTASTSASVSSSRCSSARMAAELAHEILVELDRERAAALGVSAEDVGAAMRTKIRGEVVGEMALITGERRGADVAADQPTRVLALAAEAFHELGDHRSDLEAVLAGRPLHGDLRHLRQPRGTLAGVCRCGAAVWR